MSADQTTKDDRFINAVEAMFIPYLAGMAFVLLGLATVAVSAAVNVSINWSLLPVGAAILCGFYMLWAAARAFLRDGDEKKQS